MWVAALVNACIAAATAAAFGRTLSEVLGAAAASGAVGFFVVRFLVQSAWHDATKARKQERDRLLLERDARATPEQTQALSYKLHVAELALLSPSKHARLVVTTGTVTEVHDVEDPADDRIEHMRQRLIPLVRSHQ